MTRRDAPQPRKPGVPWARRRRQLFRAILAGFAGPVGAVAALAGLALALKGASLAATEVILGLFLLAALSTVVFGGRVIVRRYRDGFYGRWGLPRWRRGVPPPRRAGRLTSPQVRRLVGCIAGGLVFACVAVLALRFVLPAPPPPLPPGLVCTFGGPVIDGVVGLDGVPFGGYPFDEPEPEWTITLIGGDRPRDR